MNMNHTPDYYTILAIPSTSTPTEIRAAWRQKAVALHPDKNPDSDTTRLFQDVQGAWEVLRDEARREKYDREWMRREREGEMVRRERGRARSEGGGGDGDETGWRQQRQRDRSRTHGEGERWKGFAGAGESSSSGGGKASDHSKLHPDHARAHTHTHGSTHTYSRHRRSSSSPQQHSHASHSSHSHHPFSHQPQSHSQSPQPLSTSQLAAKLSHLQSSHAALRTQLNLLRSEDADWEFQTQISNRQRENSIGSARNVFRKGKVRRELEDAELAQRVERERRVEIVKAKEGECERLRGEVERIERELEECERSEREKGEIREQMRAWEKRAWDGREQHGRGPGGDERGDGAGGRDENAPGPQGSGLLNNLAQVDLGLGLAASIALMATFPELAFVGLGVVLMGIWLAWVRLRQRYSC